MQARCHRQEPGRMVHPRSLRKTLRKAPCEIDKPKCKPLLELARLDSNLESSSPSRTGSPSSGAMFSSSSCGAPFNTTASGLAFPLLAKEKNRGSTTPSKMVRRPLLGVPVLATALDLGDLMLCIAARPVLGLFAPRAAFRRGPGSDTLTLLSLCLVL